MIFHHISKLALIAAICTVSTVSIAQRASNPLEPIVRCVQEGEFKHAEIKRLPEIMTSRSVETLSGLKSVTMKDGYRIILSKSQGKPFLNLKVELSAAATANDDREAVLLQMQALSSRRSADQKELIRTSSSDIEVLALNQPNLKSGGPTSFYSMFLPSKSIIATLYILNRAPDGQTFVSYADYEVHRDEAINLVQACLVAFNAY